MTTATETAPTVKKMRYEVLVGRHIEGFVRVDPDTGDITVVSNEERKENPAGTKPAAYYKGGPLGNIVESSRNLLRFNHPGSIKFKVLGPEEQPTPDIDDGLEDMTIRDLRDYADSLSIEIPQTTTKKSDIIVIIRDEMERA